jgi:hypothetical protein
LQKTKDHCFGIVIYKENTNHNVWSDSSPAARLVMPALCGASASCCPLSGHRRMTKSDAGTPPTLQPIEVP